MSRIPSVRKVVLPAAGLGTRLLSATKEQPKEMLPIFARGADREMSLKPVLQLVFEQLYDFGLREFCFVVGREKRAIEDHFTPDHEFIGDLERAGKTFQAEMLREFYHKVESATIIWVNQNAALGFGHAVLTSRAFVGSERFIVHAGDTYIVSEGNAHLKRLVGAHRPGFAATLTVQKVGDPSGFGVVVGRRSRGQLMVQKVVEKPKHPPSNLAIMPLYAFEPEIFDALSSTRPGVGGEIQLTDGIERLVSNGMKVNAVTLEKGEKWLDIGTPATYHQALEYSYEHSSHQ